MAPRRGSYAVLLLSTLSAARAFAPLAPVARLRTIKKNSSSTLRMSSWSDGESESDAEAAHMERSVKNLLAVQASASVQYYWMEFRDELQPRWLKEFEEAGHNVGQVGWDHFLGSLMRTEPEEVTVRKMAQRPKGGSGNNPFLSDTRHAMEYTVLIEPFQIAKRIMTVREQLAQEWIKDLELVETENAELLRHHVDTLSMDAKQADSSRQLVFDHDPCAVEGEVLKQLIFDHDPYGTKLPYRGKNYRADSSRQLVFDHDRYGDFAPYRNRNYRELLAMVTRVAVRRYEAELRQSGHRYHQNWLERFMLKGGKGLKGNALLESMLNGPMMMINPKVRGNSDKPRVIEPAQIAKGVMLRRATAAEEIRTILGTVPGDHLRLKASMLEQQWSATAAADVLAGRSQYEDE
ncbi:hypothetical protein JKP88DRAFT_261273 [Tribonema minus]|uniref:Uncharacterized protein n=1 Tax=Tribonema minus TaxID=303371 RepID=A0A835YQU4_9STRA|nr:hypothetical protein JKP88DRAFT_261273 [Tribonema minus]